MNKQKKFFLIITILILSILVCFMLFRNDKYEKDILSLGYDNLARIHKYENDKITRVYMSDDTIIQVVETIGYHDGLIIAVAILNEEIKSVDVLYDNETPDYGGYLHEDWFLDRFKLSINKKLERVKLSRSKENEVIAITGATITSDAVINGVNLCIDNYWRIY